MYQQFSSFQAPSSSSSSRSAVSYDYSGLDDQIKRQDELGQLRDAKNSALMGGDYDTAMKAGGRIRDLLAYTRRQAPGTTERNPMQIVNPLVRIASQSNEQSYGSTGGQAEWFRPEGDSGGRGGGGNGGKSLTPDGLDGAAAAVRAEDRRGALRQNSSGIGGSGLPERNIQYGYA